MMFFRRMGAVAEVIIVIVLFFLARSFLRDTGFGNWQEPIFGRAIISSSLLFFALPLIVLLAWSRTFGHLGLSIHDLKFHRRVSLRAMAFIAPATTLFPIILFFGLDLKGWPGAMILAGGFIAVGVLFAVKSRHLSAPPERKESWINIMVYVGLLALGLVICFGLTPISTLATKLVTVILFVGFLEEFFFRGYIQSRLNDCFGKPFVFQNVNFGVGLILAALIFGLFHPLTAIEGTPWAWGFWTAAFGLVLGFLREKTGSIIVPASLHAITLIPMVLFAPS